MMIIVAGAAVLAGLVVIRGRTKATQQDPKASVVRSWIAITLVIGLVVFCASSFGIVDPNLRSTLIGGFTASVGGAIAYYFSSKSADQARQDIMDTVVGMDDVPQLKGKTVQEAKTALGDTHLKLEVVNLQAPHADGARIVKQDPPADAAARKGSNVKVELALAPIISAIKPSRGGAGGGELILITGANLSSATAVNFGSEAATNVQAKSDSEIAATSPAGSAGSVVEVTVTTFGGTSASNDPTTQFTFQ